MPAPGGGVPGGDPPDGHCCGRYVSYRNAFLLCHAICLIKRSVPINYLLYEQLILKLTKT